MSEQFTQIEQKEKEPYEKAKKHIEKMRVSADPTRRKCVDGGYRENEAVGATAIPGADLGISMSLLGMGYSPQEAFDYVFNFVTNQGQSYCWHTDTHEGHEGCEIGCGHCNIAIQKSDLYSTTPEKIKELLKIIRQKQESNPEQMEKITLDREHKEQGILIVTNPDYTVKPWDEETDSQYFIYDETRHQVFLQQLVSFLKKQGIKMDYNKLLDESEKQLEKTLGLLPSSKNKPIFSVDVSEDNPMIIQLNNAPSF